MAEFYDTYLPAIGTPLVLRPVDVTFVRSAVGASATADVVVDVCRFDANPTLVSSNDPGTAQTTARVGSICTRCQTIRAANPTLFDHTLRLINASRYLWTTMVLPET